MDHLLIIELTRLSAPPNAKDRSKDIQICTVSNTNNNGSAGIGYTKQVSFQVCF